MTLSVVIPVYKKPGRLIELLSHLAPQLRAGDSVVVAVDGERNLEIQTALDASGAFFKGGSAVLVVYGDGEHRGKAATINFACARLQTDALCFFDNDIRVQDVDLSILRERLEEYELIEFPKLGEGEGFVAKLMKYHFAVIAMSARLMSKASGRCPSMNGSAFAVRTELFRLLGGFRARIDEDQDFAARAWCAKARFCFEPCLTVQTDVPESFHDWMKQQKRWTMNNGFWLSTWRTELFQDKKLGLTMLSSFFLMTTPILVFLACLGCLIAGLVITLSAHSLSLLTGILFLLIPLLITLSWLQIQLKARQFSRVRYSNRGGRRLSLGFFSYIAYVCFFSPVYWLLSAVFTGISKNSRAMEDVLSAWKVSGED
jgi:cellulose synthase/poly-beta-1,6-N-acetylglucosamine synthase-like glycosyltransferase